jgi:hypothetical protein
MGCDIHIYVERKTETGWEAVQGLNPWISHYKEWVQSARDRGEHERADELYKAAVEMEVKEPWVYEGWIYNGRNYALFAMLADVRNDYNFKPISHPKGLPSDVSDYVKQQSDQWGEDGHSHSWLSLRELLDYDWEQTATIKGWVTKEQAEEYRRTGKTPSHWSSDVWPRDRYEEISWQVKYSDYVRDFIDYSLLKLKQFACPPEDIRIVFWFDN